MASTIITKLTHLQIPLDDVVKATNNFHDDNIVGHGQFGTAYKGQLLRSGMLMSVAVRRLDRKHGAGDVEFLTEVSMLSDLNHKNLVSIIGFCDENGEKVIVTTYHAKGSLGQFLNSQKLTWTQRLKICLGVARAMSYLHYDEGRGYSIIHRFINSSTILLDENWEVKLSGFEISIKQLLSYKDQVYPCEPTGIIEYTDPTIEKTGGVTNKSDIYSFGVVLLEILCGRKAFIHNTADRYLVPLAKSHYENKTMRNIIHPEIWNQMSPQSFVKYSEVAYSCIQEERANRPDINNIVEILEKALELQLRRENLITNLEHLKIRSSVINSAIDRSAKTSDIGPYILYKAHFNNFDKENPSSLEGKDKSKQPKRHNNAVIKRMLPIHVEQKEEIFLNEIEMLSSVRHRNIVTLLGFCVENSEMILIIENLSNGYLGDWVANINNMRIMTWEKRLKICIDIAHALNYLHYEMENRKVIINSDVKSDNIGLDEHCRAKIVDFGLSVFMPPNQDDEAFGTKMLSGTRCYIDPEYWGNAMIKRESDVYSFGVVLLEILCGRLAYDPIYLKESDKGLAPIARRCFLLGNLENMIDPILKTGTSEENSIINGVPDNDSLNTYFEIAYKCVAETQSQRPTIKFVVEELEKALFFQERVRRPNMDQAVQKLEKAMEDQLMTHEIHEERLNADHEREKAREHQLRHETLLKNLEHLKISLSDIKLATDNFSERCRIPITDYYTLYRTCLHHYEKNNTSSIEWKTKDKLPWRHDTMVIKRILPRDDKKGEEVFFREIEILTSVKHRNIVTLLGFCVEGSEMILVIENVSNGYLGEYLRKAKDMCILTWEKRLKICIDVAHALNYLHCEMEDEKMTINRDIKSYNIGLDENWEAKIAEFGLSVFVPPNQEDEALYPDTIVGRIYYRDPEYSNTGKLKRESDVYSFGVILFEILCGRIAYDPIYLKKSDKGLAYVARQYFCTETIKDIMDPRLKTESSEKKFILNNGPNKDSLNTFCKLAYQCIAETQGERPTMKFVVKELEKALFLQVNNKDNPRISLEDIKLATQNFHLDNCIGKGGFGNVYRGSLRDGDGVSTIVAKRLDTKSSQGRQQFLIEIQILLEYKHENVIGLVGYCDEKDEKVIVYEYASMRSLDFHLKDTRLTWVKRLEICIDVARALDFLHEGVGRKAKVIHRDIKPANILLSHNWKAKLADFGLSLISPINQDTEYIIDHVCGTIGYLDPLYRKSGFLTMESDIYSFGIVLFEILCGRSTFEVRKNEGEYLSSFITKNFEEGKHDEVVFEQIRKQIVPESLTTFQNIAYQCLHHEREKRPTTKEVLIQLEKVLRFQISKGD